MSILSTLRFGLKKYTAGSDPHPTRDEFNLMIDAIENSGAIYSQGLGSARPAAGVRGRFYATTDTPRKLFYDDGANWTDFTPIGGGGAGRPILISGSASEGTSAFAARADHSHYLPPASASTAGSMSVGDKQKLDAATPLATPSTVARRDASGRLSVATPVDADHAANLAYVAGQIDSVADYIDETTLICTSTTRPPHAPGRLIYETDTTRELRSIGGAWQIQRSQYRRYVPQWNGFERLGAGFFSEGEWAWISPETVRVSALLRAGTGVDMSMGNARLSFTLPIPTASTIILQEGVGAHTTGGVNGHHRRIIVETGQSNGAAEVWAWPTPNTRFATLGEAGYGWGPRDELHAQLIYKAVPTP